VTVGNILPGSWSNSAQVLVPAGISDPDLANNRATFSYSLQSIYLPVALKQYPPGE
jgi:hypothetical protein